MYEILTKKLEPDEAKRLGDYYYAEDELRKREKEYAYDCEREDRANTPTIGDYDEE